jgi:para-aminobenzoate synthetase/4-amino-4-deoxychorismate lyase
MPHAPSNPVAARFHDRDRDEWLAFEGNPERICEVRKLSELHSAFAEAESWAVEDGLYVVCMIAYEAAPGFDPCLTVREDGPDSGSGFFPLAVFLGFLEPAVRRGNLAPPVLCRRSPQLFTAEDCRLQREGDWLPELTDTEYHERVGRVKKYIRNGDTYQVNLTQRLHAGFDCEIRPFFERMIRAQQDHYGALIELDDWAVMSASPELFFRRDGKKITARPMKGTVSRGLWPDADLERREWLRGSQKNRAENVMIVDMMRNDLGRIAIPGSVQVQQLFEIERYPTLWQMTSTVACDSERSLGEIMAALFPCASITGAPKRRTMEIIAELETSPRRVYTGTVGVIRPNGDAVFNVAIRTVLLDRRKKHAEFGVGGGVVWDSTANDEAEECVTKARVLTHVAPEFELFETLLWTPDDGFLLLDFHLDRMAKSAEYFGFEFDRKNVLNALEPAVLCRRHPPGFTAGDCGLPPPKTTPCPWSRQSSAVDTRRVLPQGTAGSNTAGARIRIVLSRSGEVRVETQAMEIAGFSGDVSPCRRAVKVRLADEPVDSCNVFLYHKTTLRNVYDRARQAHPDAEDVLLWNEHGRVTESSIANVVFEMDGRWYTPPIADGLLAGTYRRMLLESGKAEERSLQVEDIQRCDRLFLVNSVRGMREAKMEKRQP